MRIMLKFKCLIGFLLICFSLLAQTPAITTEHGYRFYHHINKGSKKAQRGESIRAYVNVFIGDTLLSSSRKNLGGTYKYDIPPAGATLDHYPPLLDAVLLMGVGDSASIYQPVDTTMRRFLPKGTDIQKELRFEIALDQIISMEDKAKENEKAAALAATIKKIVEQRVTDYVAGNLNNELTTTKSGLKYLIVEKGRGKPVQENEAVQVHYYGFLTNGSSFDNSFERRHPMTFPAGAGNMIPGFDEGVMLLTHGSKAYFFIPSKLAYGEEAAAGGAIPPNSELIFYLEIQ